ncbi:CDP-glycerol glycerophosphotransferase family protein [Staphylococcus sp. SQ8-PEA]|uniref:CDP-glycerol glycerophosphotransferase family protein n=1 Tax=Staphylococcus marylandisciuri TaxID=2981529 RepID=A0ABT2QSH6_9STAP|nr:teichoic acid glycerol-phosphate primase TarB [Staphylococcus marylandisciuri]MCU5746915.1 CDP-glycerol glycerophosphotransferase family protein [Staphylococcus marylandisciuri]
MRLMIKKLYLLAITLLNLLYSHKKVNQQQIVILMTFAEDVLPILERLNARGYQITVITKEKHKQLLQEFKHVKWLPAGNKHVIEQVKALSMAKLIIIDTYYLMMGSLKKKPTQTVLQTWHAAGALKNFGFTDHQVDLKNKKMVEQYRRVYNATDKYLVGGNPMIQCFGAAFGAKPHQFLKTGLPRLAIYRQFNAEEKKKELKRKLGISKKVVVYLPTYREHKKGNQTINTQAFEKLLPNYVLLKKLHPAVADEQQTNLDVQTLILIADVIITDYSSLAIEASIVNKPTLFYVYDEKEYERVRGLNMYYKNIPREFKAYDEGELLRKLASETIPWTPLFESWHEYTSQDSLKKVVEYIEGLMVK